MLSKRSSFWKVTVSCGVPSVHQTSVAADSGAEKHSFWHQTPDSVDSGAENAPSVHQTELSGCELPVNGKNKIPQKSINFLIEKMFFMQEGV